MEKFIENTFKRILNQDVKVFLNQYENYSEGDDESYSIYILNEDNKEGSKEKFKAYAPDFEIFQIFKTKEWLFNMVVQTDFGDYWQPPEFDAIESSETYGTVEVTLLGLINQIVKDKFGDLLMCREEAKYHEEYLNREETKKK
jgi:hypothetical protein